MSVFIARAHIFPSVMQKTGMLYALAFAPLFVMVGSLIRMAFVRGKPRVVDESCRSRHGAGILWAMLQLESAQEFRPAFDVEFFEALPARPGVFLLAMTAAGARPYLARTADIQAAATAC